MKKNDVLAVLIPIFVVLIIFLGTSMDIKTDPVHPCSWNCIKYYNVSKKTDPELKAIFDDYNNKYFMNTIGLDKIIYEVPAPLVKGWEPPRGISCNYIIVINPSIKNNPELLKSTVLHEMIHCFVTQNYVTEGKAGKKTAIDNCNHRGPFHEIEQNLKLQGAPISEDYLHDVTATIEQSKKSKIKSQPNL